MRRSVAHGRKIPMGRVLRMGRIVGIMGMGWTIAMKMGSPMMAQHLDTLALGTKGASNNYFKYAYTS